jgi:mono/diheme cytochrome c family protein
MLRRITTGAAFAARKESSMTRKTLIALAVAAFFPLVARAEADKKTERLWKAKCASCHGSDGKGQTDQGTKMGIADYADPAWQKAHSAAQVKAGIEAGVNREKGGKKQEMDPFKDKLEPAQIDALVVYVKGLK